MTVGGKERKEENKDKEVERDHYIYTHTSTQIVS